MSEHKRGSSNSDYDVLKERKLLEGVCWAEWKNSLIDSLKEENMEMPSGTGEKILHEIFIARRLKKIGVITNEKMIENMRTAIGENDDLIDNNSAMSFSIKFITNRIGG